MSSEKREHSKDCPIREPTIHSRFRNGYNTCFASHHLLLCSLCFLRFFIPRTSLSHSPFFVLSTGAGRRWAPKPENPEHLFLPRLGFRCFRLTNGCINLCFLSVVENKISNSSVVCIPLSNYFLFGWVAVIPLCSCCILYHFFYLKPGVPGDGCMESRSTDLFPMLFKAAIAMLSSFVKISPSVI